MQGRAGHATAKLTMELYAHVSDSADRQAADALNRHFQTGNGSEALQRPESGSR